MQHFTCDEFCGSGGCCSGYVYRAVGSHDQRNTGGKRVDKAAECGAGAFKCLCAADRLAILVLLFLYQNVNGTVQFLTEDAFF